ncbi:MAG TPA: AAA family ATPase [Gemmataceae bacterium]|nr:AAA family ATPase [Gemmataceae bacterium]
MSILIKETDLPQELTAEQAVESAYSTELAEVTSKVQRGLPALIECDKDLAPFLYMNLRNRLRAVNLRCLYLDGRPRQEEQGGAMPMGMMGTMISQLREAVRGPVERRIVVLPHLDLLTTSQGGLTTEAREVIPLLYENPELVWVGFKDPSFPLPQVIENLFPHRVSLLGIRRNRLRHLITRKESRKFGREFNPWALYKFVSGINAVRLRKLLSTLEGEDYPANPQSAYRQLRQATLGGTLEVPNIRFDEDIGGYVKVKDQLRNEVLNLLARKEQLTGEESIRAIEELIPKGMIFWGPPGTGKTLFAKAMAAEIGAAVTIVSGPELKSKWVGESEENLRQIFHKARQSAPSIIVFDELDSFASARGTYTGSGVEHSMVNQLLTEMDGFHREEMVFVVGTTNFVEILDPALLRPGRFEFHLHIPYPDADARREIIRIYDRKMELKMSEETLEYTVKRTGHGYLTPQGTPFSGDHINALCRSIARLRLREERDDASTPKDVERALTEYQDRPKMTRAEERVLATHEAGHAICSLFCKHTPPIERITIESDNPWAFGYVRHQDPAHRYIRTRNEYLDAICVALGAREAETLLLDDLSMGAVGDLETATAIARELVEVHGLGGPEVGVARFVSDKDERQRRADLSENQKDALDRAVRAILEEGRLRAAEILRQNLALLESLRDLLMEKKTIDGKTLVQFAGDKATPKEPWPEGDPVVGGNMNRQDAKKNKERSRS